MLVLLAASYRKLGTCSYARFWEVKRDRNHNILVKEVSHSLRTSTYLHVKNSFHFIAMQG